MAAGWDAPETWSINQLDFKTEYMIVSLWRWLGRTAVFQSQSRLDGFMCLNFGGRFK